MKRVAFFVFLALAAVDGYGEWIYKGQFGSRGSGNGEFSNPADVAVGPNGYIYVADNGNNRVQYFKVTNPAVEPASLGRVKALFR